MNEERRKEVRRVPPAVVEYSIGTFETMQATIAEQAREIERLKADLDECDGCRWKLRTELAALKSQQGGVVLPERKEVDDDDPHAWQSERGWNACIDEVARLNSSPVSAGDGMCNADNPGARCICREEFGYRVCAGGVDERAECAEWIENNYGFPAGQLCLMSGKDLERAFSGGWQARAAYPDHSAQSLNMVPDVWNLAVDGLPACGKTVLAYYLNSHGMGRRIRAMHVKRFTVEAEEFADPDTQCCEYSEQDDCYYTTEGWYELIDNWPDYSSCAVIEGVITHWMPLPAAPSAGSQGGDV